MRWAAVGQVVIALYLIAASFFRAGLQGRHREAYDMYAAGHTNAVGDPVISIARHATKASEWAESAAWHTMLVGGSLLFLGVAQLVVTRRAQREGKI
jgi:hypothetical protein